MEQLKQNLDAFEDTAPQLSQVSCHQYGCVLARDHEIAFQARLRACLRTISF
jgi:hypothetical protein